MFVVHRALYGSFERFIGLLLEHYAGALPAWLAPVQVRVVPGRRGPPRGRRRARGSPVRATCGRRSTRAPTLAQARIRDAELQKVPVRRRLGRPRDP